MKEHYLFWQFFVGEYLTAMCDTGEVDPCDIEELLEDLKDFYVTTLRDDEPRIIRMRCSARRHEKEMECEHVFIPEECGCCMICTECHKLQAVTLGESNHKEVE